MTVGYCTHFTYWLMLRYYNLLLSRIALTALPASCRGLTQRGAEGCSCDANAIRNASPTSAFSFSAWNNRISTISYNSSGFFYILGSFKNEFLNLKAVHCSLSQITKYVQRLRLWADRSVRTIHLFISHVYIDFKVEASAGDLGVDSYICFRAA